MVNQPQPCGKPPRPPGAQRGAASDARAIAADADNRRQNGQRQRPPARHGQSQRPLRARQSHESRRCSLRHHALTATRGQCLADARSRPVADARCRRFGAKAGHERNQGKQETEHSAEGYRNPAAPRPAPHMVRAFSTRQWDHAPDGPPAPTCPAPAPARRDARHRGHRRDAVPRALHLRPARDLRPRLSVRRFLLRAQRFRADAGRGAKDAPAHVHGRAGTAVLADGGTGHCAGRGAATGRGRGLAGGAGLRGGGIGDDADGPMRPARSFH